MKQNCSVENIISTIRTTNIGICIALAAICTNSNLAHAQLTFEGIADSHSPVSIDAPASSGLDAVYVLWQTDGVKATYTATNASQASGTKWYRFSNLGGGYAEEINSISQGSESSIYLTDSDMGFIIETQGRQKCYWIVNYANHQCELNALDIAPEQECDRTALLFSGSADKITYYSINGAGLTLSRDLQLEYNTLTYDEDRMQYVQSSTTETLEYAESTIRTDAPLCDTEFTLTGDKFLSQWGMEKQISSPSFTTLAIGVQTSAVQTERNNDNEQKEETTLGGSGPVEITFTAAVTDAVIYKEWQFSRDQEFEDIDLRIQELEVVHQFDEQGTTYVRFVAGNDSGSCEYTGETYSVFIGESHLDCPNAFSPGATEGTNDEWKVSYKSIVEFDCHIFNRWGLEMAHLTDPSQGWDGKYKGKLVPAGVYYYVIKAKGTDGKSYKKSGDINIIKYNDKGATTTTGN